MNSACSAIISLLIEAIFSKNFASGESQLISYAVYFKTRDMVESQSVAMCQADRNICKGRSFFSSKFCMRSMKNQDLLLHQESSLDPS